MHPQYLRSFGRMTRLSKYVRLHARERMHACVRVHILFCHTIASYLSDIHSYIYTHLGHRRQQREIDTFIDEFDVVASLI